MPATADLRTLRQRRERAQDWINYASWTAMGTAALGSLVILAFIIEDPTITTSVTPVLSTLFAKGLIGYKLRERSQWAAWGLMVTYFAAIATSLLVFSIWSGIVGKVVIGLVYVRGWLGTMDYVELNKQIAALSANADTTFTA